MRTLILTDHPRNDLRVSHSQRYIGNSVTLQVPKWLSKFQIFPGYPLIVYLMTLFYKFDRVYCHDLWMALAGIKTRKPVMSDLHEDFYDCYNHATFKYSFLKWFVRQKRMTRLIRKVQNGSGELITVSDGLARKYVAYNHYPNVQEKAINYKIKTISPCLVYLGGMRKGRGLDDLAAAIPNIEHRCNIYLIGDNIPFMQGSELVDVYNVPSGHSSIDRIMRMACVGLLPNTDTPQNKYCSPNKLWLYMSHGMAVLARPWMVNVCDIITKYDCGHVNLGLAEGINEMITNPVWLDNMGKNGKLATALEYNAETLIKPILERL